jgi:hypothetical protein
LPRGTQGDVFGCRGNFDGSHEDRRGNALDGGVAGSTADHEQSVHWKVQCVDGVGE